MSKIKSRILQLIEVKGISTREFCRQIDVSHTYLNGDSEIGSDKMETILSIFPELSIEWLVTGTGQMFKNNNAAAEKNDKNSERIDKLLDIVASQQKTIELLTQKGAAADVPGVAGKAVQG